MEVTPAGTVNASAPTVLNVHTVGAVPTHDPAAPAGTAAAPSRYAQPAAANAAAAATFILIRPDTAVRKVRFFIGRELTGASGGGARLRSEAKRLNWDIKNGVGDQQEFLDLQIFDLSPALCRTHRPASFSKRLWLRCKDARTRA